MSDGDESRNWARATIAQLEEWEGHGAIWRAVRVSDKLAVVDLCSCTGEPMERVQSDAPELIDYVRSRPDH